MQEYTYKLDDYVYYNYDGVSGAGLIKGVATTPMAVIGAIYIVQTLDVISETYPFTAIAIPEHALSPV